MDESTPSNPGTLHIEEHQNTDPFKFILYSGKIGEQTPQMAATKVSVPNRGQVL